MIISKKEKRKKDFENAKSCHICNKEYKKGDFPVRDHCHVTGNTEDQLMLIVIYHID